MVEGARLRARDEAWRFAHLMLAAGAKMDAAELTLALELAPRADGGEVDDVTLDGMAAENRRRREERAERAWRRGTE